MKALPTLAPAVCRRWIFTATLALSLSVAWPAWAAAPFTVNDNGTVTDATTNLVWDQCIVGRSTSTCLTDTPLVPRLYGWPGALAAAVAANTANYKGFNDWRVPNVKELESITRFDTWTSGQATIDAEAFPNTPISGDTYHVGGTWTSTPYSPIPSRAWYVVFGYGEVLVYGRTVLGYVRLVRSGQSLAPVDLLDITPPTTTAGTTLSGAPTTSTAGISVTINEAGTGYWLLVSSAAAAPTPAQVVAGVNYGAVSVVASGNLPMSAATPASISLTGLTPGTAYKLYFVAKDTSNNQQSLVGSVAVTTALADTTPPVTTAAPAISGSPTARTAGISVTINEAGTGYWLLVPSAATAPTSEQVVTGVNYAGVTVVRSGNIAMAAATPAIISLSGLTPGTACKLYFVAKDTANNQQASPSSVAVTTAASSTDLTPILMLLLD
ncbi:MAG: DUF1566 domain-containing protein [Comamonadaceae bacterium]|nr:DUF1566 domain-containing protein [Comamonadaceae bacterium]